MFCFGLLSEFFNDLGHMIQMSLSSYLRYSACEVQCPEYFWNLDGVQQPWNWLWHVMSRTDAICCCHRMGVAGTTPKTDVNKKKKTFVWKISDICTWRQNYKLQELISWVSEPSAQGWFSVTHAAHILSSLCPVRLLKSKSQRCALCPRRHKQITSWNDLCCWFGVPSSP